MVSFGIARELQKKNSSFRIELEHLNAVALAEIVITDDIARNKKAVCSSIATAVRVKVV